MKKHHVPQEYDGFSPVDVRGSWDLSGVHAAQFPDYKGNKLDGKQEFRNFTDLLQLGVGAPIILVGQKIPYMGEAPLDVQPSIHEIPPYELA